jgi:RNA polymerase sigma factor (sigma-70 family)
MAEPMAPDVVAVLVDHHRRFLDFLEPRVGSRAAAEDVLQAAYVKGLERGGSLRHGESAVAWFYRLLRNAVVDVYRHRDAERRAHERLARQEPDATEAPELEAVVCQCVHGLIPTLKKEYAGILRRVEMEGASVTDAARELGITAGNAAVRLHRARLALKARLEAACGTCTEHRCLDCACRPR